MLVQSPEQLQFSNLVSSVQQKASKSVIVVVVITYETSFDQVDSHPIPSSQLYGHNIWRTVFFVLAVLFEERRHHPAINLQVSAGGQGLTHRSYPIDSDCEAVDTSAGNSEESSWVIVAVPQVDEDVFVDNDPVVSEGAIAAQTLDIVKSDWEGTAAGWKHRE